MPAWGKGAALDGSPSRPPASGALWWLFRNEDVGTVPLLMCALLGHEVDPERGLLRLATACPDWFDWVRIDGIEALESGFGFRVCETVPGTIACGNARVPAGGMLIMAIVNRISELAYRELALDDSDWLWELWDGVPREKPLKSM